jgi:hypothetical protein
MYTQIIGKMRLALTPNWNQWWNVAFYLTARGMTTSPIPYGDRTFEFRFDFIDHALVLETSEGYRSTLPLVPRTVADFYEQVHGMLSEFHLEVPIWTHPVEVTDGIPFEEDTVHGAYDDEEVCSLGFWPGNDATGGPMLYSYISPEPAGYAGARVLPPNAFYSRELKEYLLPYDAVREAPRPDAVILEFAESAYVAGATHAGWDLAELHNSHADPEPAVAFTDAALPEAPP